MARRLTDDAVIDQYVLKVIKDAHHHAPNVVAVVMPLSQAVRSRLNLTVDKIEVYERNGQTARTCWITIQQKRYVFTYNHSTGKIDLKNRSLQGPVLHTFENDTSQAEIDQQVAAL